MLTTKQLAEATRLASRYEFTEAALSQIKIDKAPIQIMILNQNHAGDDELMSAIRGAFISVYEARLAVIGSMLLELGVDPELDPDADF